MMAKDFGTDIEVHWVALPVADPAAHALARQRWQSKEWWTVIGFESEDRVRKIVDIINASEAECEQFIWPIGRVGEFTGGKEDNIIVLFARKSSLKPRKLRGMLLEIGGRLTKRDLDNLDFIPVSCGYVNAVVIAFQSILQLRSEIDN